MAPINHFVASLTGLAMFAVNLFLLGGALMVQVPQILKISRSKSALGLSEASWIMQCFSTGMYLAFNYANGYPFMTWGDSFFAGCQYIILVLLIWHFGTANAQRKRVRLALSSLFIILVLCTLTDNLPKFLVYMFGVAPMPMIVASRLPQILLNYRQKHTGQLALPSLMMQVGGNSARVVSTILQVKDPLVLASHTTAMLVNGTVLGQIVYYWSNTQDLNAKAAAHKEERETPLQRDQEVAGRETGRPRRRLP